jgi:hypothetical protein
MSKMKYVYSTLSADNIYGAYVKGGADLPMIDRERQVLIKGGSNVADKRLITPRGVVTEVSEDQLAALLENTVFQMHVENGYVTFSDHNEDPEKVIGAEGLEARDASSPLEPGDFVADDAGAKPSDVIRSAADDAAPPAPHSAPPAHPAANSARRTRA